MSHLVRLEGAPVVGHAAYTGGWDYNSSFDHRMEARTPGSGQPTAFAELRALDLSESMAKPFSAALAGFLEEKLSISPNRLFINFFDIPRPLWGWNGSTFG